MFVLVPRATLSLEITQSLEQIKVKMICEKILYIWLHGYFQPNDTFNAIIEVSLDGGGCVYKGILEHEFMHTYPR